MRFVILLLALIGTAMGTEAQLLSGRLAPPNGQGHWLVLLATRGGEHYPIDSARISAAGEFDFHNAKLPGDGFYQLSLNDTDRVDVILDHREKQVELTFSGVPLQRHVVVNASRENKRLWTYKLVSRETQAIQEAVTRERKVLDPSAYRRLHELDSIEQAAAALRDRRLSELAGEDRTSFFAKVVMASAGLDREVSNGPMAVAAVFDFGDPALLRSSVYDKAVMSFLQSINAISEEQITNASDTLMRLASRDPECEAYMIEHLVDIFSTYGPQGTLQHLVDAYLAGANPKVVMSPRLRGKVERLLDVSIGAIGPDVDLVDTTGARTALSTAVAKQAYSLLFFYSSTCDHCHSQMPGLNEAYRRYRVRGLEILGIALDADTVEFLPAIRQQHLQFPCYSEFTGWGSGPAKAYEVKATPTLILLDRSRRILAKPYDADALLKELERRLP